MNLYRVATICSSVKDGESLIEAEQLGLVTTSYHIIAEKC